MSGGASSEPCLDGLFKPIWGTLATGAKVTVVLTDMIWSSNAGLGKVLPGGQIVRVSGLIPPSAHCANRVTLVDCKFLSVGMIVDLEVDDSSTVLCHQSLSMSHVFNLIEICAGVGLSALGFEKAGFRQVCAVEKQPKLAALHQRVHPDVPVICADITDDSAVCQVFAQCPEPATVMAGFSCQPFSRGGSQQGEHDSRSTSLPGTLRFMHMVQAPALILECVVPARTNQYVRQHVHALTSQLGYHVVDCTLKLEDVWSACRYRWWVIATHPCIGAVKIPPYPQGCTLVVRDLMPYVHRWPAEDEHQLVLTPEEIRKFQAGGLALKQYAVKPEQKLPTALHSWGNQTTECPCQCRSQSFSDGLLIAKGIYSQLLQMPPTDDAPGLWRHLHVLEVSLLNGVPLHLRWGHEQRLNLRAAGQMAAPLHSIWIASALARHVQLLFTNDMPLEPTKLLNDLKHEVLLQSKQLYPDVPSTPTMPTMCTVVINEPGLPEWTLSFHSAAKVQDLVQAHCRLHGVAIDDVCVKDPDDKLVSHDTSLAELVRLTIGCTAAMFVQHQPDAILLAAPLCEDDFEDPEVLPALATQVDDPNDHDAIMDFTDDVPAPHDASVANRPSNVQDNTVVGLGNLDAHQLVAQLPPLVLDLDLCSTMREPLLTAAARLHLLDRQGGVWADDEVWWQMQALGPLTRHTKVAMLDPLLATTWLAAQNVESVRHWIDVQPDFDRIATVVLHQGHWTPCVWVKKLCELEVHLWEHESVDVEALNPLHGLMCQALQVPMFQTSCTRRQFGLQNCGAASIAFLQFKLHGLNLPVDDAHLAFAAQSLREDFRMSHDGFTHMPRPWCWGAGVPEVLGITATILQQHGVPQSASTSRAKLLMQSLGPDNVKQAVQGTSPWKTLKSLANQQTPPFQLVLPDELAAVQQERKPKTRKANAAAAGPRKHQTSKPVELDPTRLELAENTFKMDDGTVAMQLPLAQVGPLASGVALVSYQDAQPFLQSGRQLTGKGLALLVLNGPDELVTNLPWSSIRFAAKCAVNQQPVLLSGHLVQLGGQSIGPYFRSDGHAVADVPVACARLTVFADQVPQDWDTFSAHPFKHLLAMLPPLQSCRNEECQCDKWHVDQMSQVHDVLLDVFKRQFFTEAGRPTKPQSANHFSVHIRYLKSQELALLRLSGTHGIYVEPRLPDSTSPSDEFQVVWLPQATFATAQHQAQCEPLCIGLARSGRRFGLRVAAKQFQQLFQKLKPEGQFLSPGARQLWHCGPWPYGSDRKSLGKVFTEWSWQARPLQPAKPITGGVMWLIQSVAPPPQTVYNMAHGQVVISKCDSLRDGMMTTGSVVGPQSTVDLCAATSSTDPWLVRDPWQQAIQQMPKQQSPDVASHLQEMEDRMTQHILDKLPQGMETDETENRLQLLEHQLHQLATRHQSLENTVTEHHRQNSAQVQTLQAQMMSQMEVQSTQMARMFEDQMTKLETILSKKGRYHE